MIEKFKKNWLLIILISFSLVPIFWFVGKGSVLINGLDTNFPLDPTIWFKRRLFVWNDVASGGINFSSSTAGIFFHLIQVIPYILGLNLQITQIVSLIFWFSLLVFSAYYFSSKVTPNSKISQLVFVTLYVFNIYLFNTWENVKVANLAVVTALPLFLGVYISYINKEIKLSKLIFYTAIISIISSGAGINPAYFITILGGLIIFGLVQIRIRTLGLMLGVICLINSFWIVPTANQLLFSQNGATSLSDIGFTNWLDSLSENTSLLNVFRLQGAWDWYATDDAGTPLYIPYASNYFNRLPFVVFSILLPTLAILGFLVKEEKLKKIKIYFGILLMLGLFLGSGTHAPTGILYEFLTKNLPFFSFFRSPWYIFTPYLVLSSAAMISYLFSFKKKILKYVAFILIIGNLIYVYPLVTGRIYRPLKSDSFFVKFPEYVFDTKEWLDNQNQDGRIVSYPGDEIENFKWGYRGIESILNLLTSRETIFSGLNDITSPSAKITRLLYSSLRRNQFQIAESIAAKLNVSDIFVKKDQSSLWDIFPNDVGNYTQKSFGEWQFYQIPNNEYLPKIYSPEKIYFGLPSEKLEELIGFVSGEEIVVNTNDTVVKQIPNNSEFVGDIVFTQNSQLEDFELYQKTVQKQSLGFTNRNLNQIKYSMEVLSDGFYQPVLESFLLDKFGVDWSNGLKVLVDGQEQTWIVKEMGDLIIFNDIKLLEGRHNVMLELTNRNLIQFNNEITELINREEKEKYLSFLVKPFVSSYPYLIEFDYKNIYGRKSTFKVEQKNDKINYKFQTEGPPFSPEKIRFSFYFDPIPVTDSYLLIKPSIMPVEDDPLGTKIEYSNLAIYPVFTNKMVLIKQPQLNFTKPREINFKKISPVKYDGEVKKSEGSHIIVFSENFSKDWEIKLFNLDGSEITYKPLHFSANMYANAWFIEDLVGDYKFEIYYKPQNVFITSVVISLGTLLSVVVYFIWKELNK